MIDVADHVGELEAAAMERFEAEQALARRVAEARHGYDPARPVNCVQCGDDVPAARLKALPHTRRCAACAAEVERVNGWGAPR